jgi:hypothetical protein
MHTHYYHEIEDKINMCNSLAKGVLIVNNLSRGYHPQQSICMEEATSTTYYSINETSLVPYHEWTY